MAWDKFVLIAFLGNCPLASADELAFGYVDANSKLENMHLTPFATARGAANFFLADPMDSHDFTHVFTLHKTLNVQIKTANTSSSKVASLEEALKPIFMAMPKNSEGRLNNGTARYALHRFFTEKLGWSIKGLPSAGASWIGKDSVDEEVKDLSKYMVPSYLQDLMMKRLGVSSFDLHSLAILAATLEHLIHAEMIDLVYSVYKTLELPIAGKRTKLQVDNILDAYMMVYVFGVNLDVSNHDDLMGAQLHLNTYHAGWPQLQVFAHEIKQSMFKTGELNFDEIVHVVEKIGEKYVEWRATDCSRVKDELVAKPSQSKGAVKLSEAGTVMVNGHRGPNTENVEDLGKLGALQESTFTEARLIIPNYINSQSMCLSTASFYAACCTNECEGLLAKVEREVRAPMARPEDLAFSMKTLMQGEQALLEELEGLKDRNTGLVPIHSSAFAEWMHRAFPLQCPAPGTTHLQKVANPKTPNEWIGDATADLTEFQELMEQIRRSLARYTTMGAEANGPLSGAGEAVQNSDTGDVERVLFRTKRQDQQSLVPAVHLAAAASMMMLAVAAIKSGLGGLRCLRWPQKGRKATT